MAATVYFVTALAQAERVKERIRSFVAAEDVFELAPDKWMVSYEGPTRELAEKAGVRSGENLIANGIVLAVTTYSGRGPTGLWDWLKVKGV
jgi:sarcosine oxidase gamma subunit